MKPKAAHNITLYSCSCGVVHVELRDANDRLFATAEIEFPDFFAMSSGIRAEIADQLFGSTPVEGHA